MLFDLEVGMRSEVTHCHRATRWGWASKSGVSCAAVTREQMMDLMNLWLSGERLEIEYWPYIMVRLPIFARPYKKERSSEKAFQCVSSNEKQKGSPATGGLVMLVK